MEKRWIDKNLHFILLVFAYLIYIVFTFHYINFGLKHFVSVSEEMIYLPAFHFIRNGDIALFHSSKYPSFVVYMFAFFYWLVFKIFPAFAKEVGANIYLPPAELIIIGRVITVITGGIGIYFLYKMSKEIMGEGWDFLSILLVILTPLYIGMSVMLYFDIFHVAFVTGSFYYLIRLRNSTSKKDLLRFAVLAGLSLSTRYNFLVILPAVIWWALFSKRDVKDIFLIILLPFTIFFILCPDVIFKLPLWISSMKTILSLQKVIEWDPSTPFVIGEGGALHKPYLYPLLVIVSFVLGPHIFIFSTIHFLRLYRIDRYLFWIFVPYILVFFVLVSSLAGLYSMPLYYTCFIPLFAFLSTHFFYSLKGRWVKVLIGFTFLSSLFYFYLLFSEHIYKNMERAMDIVNQ